MNESSITGNSLLLIRIALLAASAILFFDTAGATEFKIIAPHAAKEAVSAAFAVVESSPVCRANVSWSGAEAITKQISEGANADVVINASQNIDR